MLPVQKGLDTFLSQDTKPVPPQAGRVSDMSGSTSRVVDPLKVIIIGAGIGGLALAQILISAPKIQVTCYERNSSIDNGVIGFRVMLSGSTLSMLKRKLPSEIWASLALGIGVQPEGGEKIEFFKGNGDKLFTWDSDPTKDQFSVSRWQLREALLSQTKPFLRLGIAFESYELLPNGGARVHFSDGTTNECDLLVGADGLHSMVKKQLIPYATVKDLGMVCIYFKVPLTEKSLGLLESTSRSMVIYLILPIYISTKLTLTIPSAHTTNTSCSPPGRTPLPPSQHATQILPLILESHTSCSALVPQPQIFTTVAAHPTTSPPPSSRPSSSSAPPHPVSTRVSRNSPRRHAQMQRTSTQCVRARSFARGPRRPSRSLAMPSST